MSHMEAIGVRELRREASRWLARVRAGETFVITDRGQPVARLVPLGIRVGYEVLLSEGRIAPGTGGSPTEIVHAMDDDVPPDAGISVSGELEALRAGER